jgi:hypothetical protein
LHPEEGAAVEQYVAQRAAAEGRQPRDDAHAHGVEAFARRLKQPRQREGHGGGGFHRRLRHRQRRQRQIGKGQRHG